MYIYPPIGPIKIKEIHGSLNTIVPWMVWVRQASAQLLLQSGPLSEAQVGLSSTMWIFREVYGVWLYDFLEVLMKSFICEVRRLYSVIVYSGFMYIGQTNIPHENASSALQAFKASVSMLWDRVVCASVCNWTCWKIKLNYPTTNYIIHSPSK